MVVRARRRALFVVLATHVLVLIVGLTYNQHILTRQIQPTLVELANSFPVVTVTGPRQAGKTTLCRMAFPHKPYVSLEDPDERRFALDDPRGFLAQHRKGPTTIGAYTLDCITGATREAKKWT